MQQKTLVFATGNPNKIREVEELLAHAASGIDAQWKIIGLKDINCTEEIPETTPTIQGNALQKARYVADNYGVDCFSEDTGLEIDALHGEPGVDTAHYAGAQRDAEANMQKVLDKLNELNEQAATGDAVGRGAQFRTVIALIIGTQTYTFEGIVRGTIAIQKQGEKGFGYDPIFIPDDLNENNSPNYKRSFAQMTNQEKNTISHRGKAVRKLIAFLQAYSK